MDLSTRKVLDRSFTGLGFLSILLMAGSLLVLLVPVVVRGLGAFAFRGTVEHREFLVDRFGRGDAAEVAAQVEAADKARAPVYEMMAAFGRQLVLMDDEQLLALPVRARVERDLRQALTAQGQGPSGAAPEAAAPEPSDEAVARKLPVEIMKLLRSQQATVAERLEKLFGPAAGKAPRSPRPMDIYGDTRWDRSRVTLDSILQEEIYDYGDTSQMVKPTYVPRVDVFRGTSLEPMFAYLEEHIDEAMLPEWTFYWGFLTDPPVDANMFGGIWPMVLGTFYLTLGAMVFAVPAGVVTAIYLVEYARAGSRVVSVLRIFISTLAGVPSIVFGLFGLAFFINQLHVSPGKSVLAGSLTLAALVLPTVIRASEEAIRSVPHAYKEAALSLGASKWRTVVTVILPAALPGVLTGIIISMGRAAGETAPIIFTAAASVGSALSLDQVLNQPTPALPWNIYNLTTEHRYVDEIRHVQYGMVLVLLALVLMLNVSAILLRARITKKLRG